MVDCNKCKSENLCAYKDFYSPGEVRFCRPQMLWLISHLPLLESGTWPPNPEGTSYVDPIVHVQARGKAPYETSAQIYAEVSIRLEAAGEAGEVLLDEIQSGLTDVQLLSRFATSALNYISGWPQRRMSFSAWVRQRRYRENNKV